ncbi:unnamed protein product, partial [Mesorhabditis belari]|uniref:Uncharacterized protein n=1 Tax=Mesorhabditis belari TaxID=2138241 RepID=A0AAF3EC93_9BILA
MRGLTRSRWIRFYSGSTATSLFPKQSCSFCLIFRTAGFARWMDRQTIWPAPYYPWIFDKEQRIQLGRAGKSYQQDSNLNYGGEGYINPFRASLKRVVGGTFWFRTYPSEEEAPRGTCWKHEPTTNQKIYASYQNTSPNTTHRIERTFYSSSFRIDNQTQLNLHQKLTYTPNIYLNYFGLSIRVEKWSDVTREVLVIPGWVNGGPPKTLYLVVKENVTPIVIVSPATYVSFTTMPEKGEKFSFEATCVQAIWCPENPVPDVYGYQMTMREDYLSTLETTTTPTTILPATITTATTTTITTAVTTTTTITATTTTSQTTSKETTTAKDKPKNIFSRYKWEWIGAGIALIVGIGIILIIVLVRACRRPPIVSSAFNLNLNVTTNDMERAQHKTPLPNLRRCYNSLPNACRWHKSSSQFSSTISGDSPIVFDWADGTPFTFQFWAPEEPDNQGGQQVKGFAGVVIQLQPWRLFGKPWEMGRCGA